MPKRERQAAILEVVRRHRVPNQEALRELLLEEGFDVTQATLSRDMRELGLAKVPGAGGDSFYRMPEAGEGKPVLEALLPVLVLSTEGAGQLIVVRTLPGSASAVATAFDAEEWPEVLGTIAGDDTIFIAHRTEEGRKIVEERLAALADSEQGFA